MQSLHALGALVPKTTRLCPALTIYHSPGSTSCVLHRNIYTGTLLVAGGHDRATGIKSLEQDRADLIVYGRHFLANPDFVKRIELDAPLNQYDRTTFYSQDQVRYPIWLSGSCLPFALNDVMHAAQVGDPLNMQA